MGWTQPADIRGQIQRLWDKGLILRSVVDGVPLFPERLTLKGPSSRDLSERFDAVRAWIRALQKGCHYRIEWQAIRHRIIGANAIPKAVWIDSLDDALTLIGKQKDAAAFAELVSQTHTRQPCLVEWLGTHPLKALSLADDWCKLLDIVDWLKSRPDPGIYLRQVDLPGIHTKFIETHRRVLAELLDRSLPASAIHEQHKGAGQFSLRYGFLQKPSRIRFRVLDPDIALLPGENQDISIPHETFRSLHADPRFQGKTQHLFITENEINFLAFPQVANAIIVFGAGYGFDALSNVPWISHLSIHYWGDIDTHGFAILDQLRRHVPDVRSLLMDKATLLAHKHVWVEEEKPERRDLPRLTAEEAALYDDLRDNRLASNVRLEQERIGFGWVLKTIERLL